MKFCKDCKNYTAPVSACGGSLLPGLYVYIDAWCKSYHIESHVNLVSGEKTGGRLDCSRARELEHCGESARWFEPANLDGRLAMLGEMRPGTDCSEHYKTSKD